MLNASAIAQAIVPALAFAALTEYLDGDTAHARELCQEVGPAQINSTSPMAEICRILTACHAPTTHAPSSTTSRPAPRGSSTTP